MHVFPPLVSERVIYRHSFGPRLGSMATPWLKNPVSPKTRFKAQFATDIDEQEAILDVGAAIPCVKTALQKHGRSVGERHHAPRVDSVSTQHGRAKVAIACSAKLPRQMPNGVTPPRQIQCSKQSVRLPFWAPARFCLLGACRANPHKKGEIHAKE